jgi:hypothetical protein
MPYRDEESPMKVFSLLTTAAVFLTASPVFANTTIETLRAGSGAGLGVSFQALSKEMAVKKASFTRRRRRRVSPQHLERTEPFHCDNLPVAYIKSGSLYKNGKELGRASSFKAACTGEVAWMDSYGRLHKDGKEYDRASKYELSKFNGVLVWVDSFNRLHREDKELGRYRKYYFAYASGVVVWENSHGDLYKNDVEIGDNVRDFKVADFTGDVFWRDSWGELYKNKTKLGKANKYEVSYRTGDVAWTDGWRNLYKNGRKVASDVNNFTMRPDGVVTWKDRRGHTRSA